MAKPNQIILTDEGVITQEALLAYAEGRLGAAETAQVEKLLRDDPFAQDALEGIKKTADKAGMATSVEAIKLQLRERSGARERKKKGIEIHWANYAYAAVIFGVLIGVGFVMVHFLGNNNTNMAMNDKVTQGQESMPVLEEKKVEVIKDTTPVVAAAPIDTATRAADQQATTMTAPEAEVKTNENALRDEVAAKTDAATDKAKERKQTAESKDVSTKATAAGATADKLEMTKTAAPPVAAAPADKDKKAAEKKASSESAPAKIASAKVAPTTESISNGLMSAKALFDAGDYKAAEKIYNEALAADPGNPEALYFGGVSNYLNGNTSKAEPKFDKLLKKGLFIEGSKWYKANILLSKGRKDEAKEILRDLINTNSSYRDRAAKKYEELLK